MTAANTELIPGSSTTVVQSFELIATTRGLPALSWRSTGATCAIGSHPSNDLVIDAPHVSRFHCELKLGPRGLSIRDLGSSNGTLVDSVPVVEAFVRSGSQIVIGSATIDVQLTNAQNTVATSAADSFGALRGGSPVMRTLFAQLEKAAQSTISVFLEGETGTGKEEAATAIHEHSARAKKPFVVIDCSALPATLLESELFGHERGAFTGASATRIGAFEAAAGGTVFLDEIGELPLELQPKLLRVLEAQEFRRVGSNVTHRTDVRVVSATNRDLRREINEGRFRSDVYFRLAVYRVVLPPLRAHLDDVPMLARTLLASLGAPAAQVEAICTPAFLAALKSSSWTGNVRELRNHLERCLLFSTGLPLDDERAPLAAPQQVDVTRKLADERRRHVDAFEREYVRLLLETHADNVSEAAEAAGVDRAYLYRMIKRLGLRQD